MCMGVSLDMPQISTYDIVNNTVVQPAGAVVAKGRCVNRTAAYVVASKRFPHFVFSASWPGPGACGMSAYTGPGGGLADMASSWAYGNRSGIHGLALGWGINQIIYSADLSGDAIWTHGFGFYGEVYPVNRYTPSPPAPTRAT